MGITKKYDVKDVFTPTTQAKLAFIEREESINDELVDSLRTPGKQIIIFGQSGTGKSTLIVNKLDQIYENVIITRCTVSFSFEQLVYDAFDQLNVYYQDSVKTTEIYSITAFLKSSYALISSQMGASFSQQNQASKGRILPPQLTPQRLAQFLGASKSCWVIEDFHKLESKEKVKFSQNMKVFVDTASEYPDVKMIAIGAVCSAKDVINYDTELKNRVSEIHVPLLSDSELSEILHKGESLLNIKIDEHVKKNIVRYSNGLGSICHQLALNMCYSRGIYVTCDKSVTLDEKDFDEAISRYIKSNSDTLKGRYDAAVKVQRKRKYNNGKIILTALASSRKEALDHNELLRIIHKDYSEYPAGNLTLYLGKLQLEEYGKVLVSNPNSKKHSFSDPFMKTYVQCINNSVSEEKNNINKQIKKLLVELLKD